MMAAELEDDITLAEISNAAPVDDQQPRKLSRLRKANTAPQTLQLEDLEDDIPSGQFIEKEASEANDEDEQQVLELGVGEEETEVDGEYWDEEDDLENYLRTKFEKDGESSDEDSQGPNSKQDRSKKRAPANEDEADIVRDPNDLNAETQRILREAASRDRLGKGHKIDIKPINSIVEKLLQRRALAIARAPKAAVVSAPAFDDVFGAALEKRQQPADAGKNDVDTTAVDAATFSTEPVSKAEIDELDIDIASDDDSVDAEAPELALVELPGTLTKAARATPLVFPPVNDSLPFDDDYEDDVLVQNDADSDADSDSESDKSWEANEEQEMEEDEREDGETLSGSQASGLDDDDDEEEEGGKEEEEDRDIDENRSSKDLEDSHDKATTRDLEEQNNEADVGATNVQDAVATDKRSKLQDRLRRVFLDTEAELSDEEGGGIGVSDDEDEEDVDHNGEVADLIKNTEETGVDVAMREKLHRQWAEQKDAKDLQQILRGLEQGFRKRRNGAFDDDDDELDGRRRRLRMDDDDYDMPIGGWLGAAFNKDRGEGGQDDDEEDLDMLLKAQKQRLLAGSQEAGYRGGSDPGVMLDEGSQHVLELLARSGSEPQAATCPAPTSRLAAQLMSFGSGSQEGSAKRVPSFLGRQSSVHRGVSNSGFGNVGIGGGGRSFIFGKDNSLSAAPADTDFPKAKAAAAVKGPVDFTNLRQLVGMPSSGAGKRGNGSSSSLVSRLAGKGKGNEDSQPRDCDAAANAVCQQVVLAGGKRPNRAR